MPKGILILLFFLCASPANAAQGELQLNIFPAPPNLTATVEFFEPSGNNMLNAEETGTLFLVVKNSGQGDAFDVTVDIKPDSRTPGLSFERDVSIGTIPAGKRAEKRIELKASESIDSQSVDLKLNIREANGFDAPPIKLSFQTREFQEPKLIIADMGITDMSGSGRVEPGRIVDLTVRVQNIGHGNARDVSAEVQAGPNVFMAGDGHTRFDLGNLASGMFRDFKFSFYTNTRIANGERIPIDIRLGEARPRFNATQSLDLTMNTPQKQMQTVIVDAAESGEKGPIALAGGLSIGVDMNIPEGEKGGRYDIAVVIGNRDYSASGVPAVEYAVRGARVMKDYLVRTFGYDPQNIIYIENASLSRFYEIFGTERDHRGTLFNWVRESESRVFIYYAGHGAPDLDSSEAYFVPVDASPAHIRATGYNLQTFYDNLSKLPAKDMTIVLDACFSGASEGGMLFEGISPAMLRVQKEYREPVNAVLFASSQVDQVSTWYSEKRHSLFTYYFLKGIQGEADADRDGTITVGEMKHYLKENVPYRARRLSGREQQPMVKGSREDVLVVLK